MREPVPALGALDSGRFREAVANEVLETVRAEDGSGNGPGATSPLEVRDFLQNLGHRLAARVQGSMLAVQSSPH